MTQVVAASTPAPDPAPPRPGPRVLSGLGPADDTTKRLPVLELDRRTYSRALDCVHCGLCLPACPTYTQNGLEGDSPRGRIYLMKGLADGKIEATPAVMEHLDLCLDCRACETACPSGVVYHELIEETRARLAAKRTPTKVDRFVEAMFLRVFTRPARLKAALVPVRLLQKAGLWHRITASKLARKLPPQLDKMQQMLPPTGPLWERDLAPFYAAKGEKKATVGFFAGCVGSVLFQEVNRQAIELLQHARCDVYAFKPQKCCGAIHHHSGHHHEAEALAKANIDAFLGRPEAAQPMDPRKRLPAPPPVDFLVNTIAGCGAMLKDYPHLLRDDAAYAEPAKAFAAKTRDISELLVHLQPEPPKRELALTVTYHDACHLAHAQKVTAPPRAMLNWIKGLKVVPLYESDTCCGAAGTYNLTQPAMARELAERKIRNLRATGADACVTGNVGCAMQIQSEAARLGVEIKVVHPVTLLHQAYFGEEAGRG